MKIQFVVRSLNYGGAERQLVQLAKGLHRRGHSVLVTIYYPGGPLETDLQEAGVQIKRVEKRGRWDAVPFLIRLVRLIANERPDILHGYLPVSNLLVTIVKPFLPHPRIVWGVRASNVDLSRYDWLWRLVFRAECFFSRFADLIIVNSNAGKDYHKNHGFPKDKMVVIPNGIDTERFKPDRLAGERVRGEWGIMNGEKVIGLVARLDPMKDHPTFLKAAAILSKERNDVRFVCVGDGPERYKSQVLTIAGNLGLEKTIVWAGNRGDMNAVYNALVIATSASIGEGFSNVIGEAMACGVPCVVTDVGDSKWIIGNAGLLVPPGDPRALVEAWRTMLQQMQETTSSIGEQARRRVVEQFSIDSLIQKTETALKNLA